jgi:hypothetical protein
VACQWRRSCEKERVEGQDEEKKLKEDDLLFLTATAPETKRRRGE